MSLKKPSELFYKKETSSVLGTTEVSSHITESYDKFRNNFDKVNELSEKVKILSQELSEKITKSELESVILSQLMILDENFKSFQNQIKGLNKNDLREYKISSTNLTRIVEELIENEIPKYRKQIKGNEVRVNQRFEQFKESIEEKIDENVENFYGVLKEFKDVVQVVESVNAIETYIQEHHSEIVTLREEILEEINQIPLGNLEDNLKRLEKKIDYIRDTYSSIDSQSVAREIIQEGLLNEPPETQNEDPLTPLNQNFVTLDQLQQHYRLFLNRIQQQLSTLGGGGETQLKYLDDIVGIATNPSAYAGKFLRYDDTLKKFKFDNILANDLDIVQQNILYVSKDGDDLNDGSFTRPKLTIKAAVEIATPNTVVKILPGTYIEDNPISIPDQVTVTGYSLRETTVIPLNDDEDLFYVGNGCYISQISFTGTLLGKSVISFDANNRRYINQSPYVQNCTNFIPNSIGLKVDGNSVIGPLKSIVLDAYTQYNQGGIGVSITNEGYAQLVSLFTICNDIAVYCGSGGACDLTNSNASFGNYGLISDGVSGKKYTGITTVAAPEYSDVFVLDLSTPTLNVINANYDNTTGFVEITVDQSHNLNVGTAVTVSGLGFTCTYEAGILYYPSGEKGYVFNVEEITSSTSFIVNVGVSTLSHTYDSGGTVKVYVVRPFDGQAVYFNDLYYEVKTLNIINGGSGYTQKPTITISPPATSWGVKAQAAPIIENGVLVGVDMISNGRGYEIGSPPTVTISDPQMGINIAVAVAELSPEYYTINKATEITSDISVITLNENVPFAVGVGTEVNFFKQSRILATSYSFEYVGSGTDITSCLPFSGGVTIQENETDSRNGGLVVYTSTNQSGDFRIGDGVTINQNVGSITGKSYTKSLLSTMTPYILSLGGF